MDFMNLNQSAHGDREFGFICTRLRQGAQGRRRPLAGTEVQERLGSGCARPRRWHDCGKAEGRPFRRQHAPGGRDRGRQGRGADALGLMAVNGYGVGDLVRQIVGRERREVDRLCASTTRAYAWPSCAGPAATRRPVPARRGADRTRSARLSRSVGGFQRLHRHVRGPARAGATARAGVQRLMADGYGFGAEGDWKTAALVRAMKVMAPACRAARRSWRITPTTSTPPGMKVLGAHMLEICPSIAAGSPVAAKSIRWASAARPIRCAWCSRRRRARRSTPRLIDLGDRFRLLVNEVDVVKPRQPLPKLPVARALWARCRSEDRRRRLDLRRRRASHRLQLRPARNPAHPKSSCIRRILSPYPTPRQRKGGRPVSSVTERTRSQAERPAAAPAAHTATAWCPGPPRGAACPRGIGR
jgi:L-arabinose isomerase